MKEKYPKYDWSDIIDASLTGANGLRMLGSYKPYPINKLRHLKKEKDLKNEEDLKKEKDLKIEEDDLFEEDVGDDIDFVKMFEK
jgi:hypothetical protein